MTHINLSFLNDHSDELLCEVECPFCHKVSKVVVSSYDWMVYEMGENLIQDCFPTLTPSERELFITGMCEDCQKNFFD